MALKSCAVLALVEGLTTSQFEHYDIVLHMPLTRCLLTDAKYRLASCLL